MKPLSVWKYYKNNQKKVMVVFLVTFLSVFLQTLLLTFATTMIKFHQATAVEVISSMGVIATDRLSLQDRDWLKQSLDKNQDVSKVIPAAIKSTSLYSIDSAYIVFLHSKDIEAVMNWLNLTLTDGHLPTPGSTDVALHWKIAANKGLKIGDHFGRKTSKFEFLPGDCRLVGLLDGSSVIGIGDLDNPEKQITEYDLLYFVIPKKDQLIQVKNYLAQLTEQNDNFYNSDALESSYQNIDNSIIIIVNIIYLVITGIVTICVSFLFYFYFYQRRSEFALLEALGYSRQTIIGKAFLEIAGINLLGFMVGIVIASVCEWALNHFILLDRGLPLVLWDNSYAFKLLSTPLFITFSSLLPVWRMLKKVDPMSIIEGEVE